MGCTGGFYVWGATEGFRKRIETRVGHAYAKYAKYAKYAEYAHMRNMRMRMRIENLIHIFHIQGEKISIFKGQLNQESNDEKCVKYAFFSPFTIR